jgi:hypothetical protein
MKNSSLNIKEYTKLRNTKKTGKKIKNKPTFLNGFIFNK